MVRAATQHESTIRFEWGGGFGYYYPLPKTAGDCVLSSERKPAQVNAEMQCAKHTTPRATWRGVLFVSGPGDGVRGSGNGRRPNGEAG